jgi:hypothetical protein
MPYVTSRSVCLQVYIHMYICLQYTYKFAEHIHMFTCCVYMFVFVISYLLSAMLWSLPLHRSGAVPAMRLPAAVVVRSSGPHWLAPFVPKFPTRRRSGQRHAAAKCAPMATTMPQRVPCPGCLLLLLLLPCSAFLSTSPM